METHTRAVIVRECIGIITSVIVESTIGARALVVNAASPTCGKGTTAARTCRGAAWGVARVGSRSGNGLKLYKHA